MPGFLFDTNVWLGLTFASHPLHAAAATAPGDATAARRAFFCRAPSRAFCG